jgi:hypothetical protein
MRSGEHGSNGQAGESMQDALRKQFGDERLREAELEAAKPPVSDSAEPSLQEFDSEADRAPAPEPAHEAEPPATDAFVSEKAHGESTISRDEMLDVITLLGGYSNPAAFREELKSLPEAELRQRYEFLQSVGMVPSHVKPAVDRPRAADAPDAAEEPTAEKGEPGAAPDLQGELALLQGEKLERAKPPGSDGEVRLAELEPKPEIPLDPADLQPVMKERREDGAEWDEVNALEARLRKRYEVRIIRDGRSPEQHLAALQMIEGMIQSAPARFRGLDIKISSQNKYLPQYGKIEINPDSDEKEMRDFLDYDFLGKRRPAPKVDAYARKPDLGVKDGEVLGEEAKREEASAQAQPAAPQASDLANPENTTVDVEAPALMPEHGPVEDPGIKARLDAARDHYVLAKARYQQFRGLKKAADKFTGMSLEDADTVEFKVAQAEYQEAREKFVGANLERHLQEKLELCRSHQDEYGQLESGWAEKLRAGWRGAMDANIADLFKRRNGGKEIENGLARFLCRRLSMRNGLYALAWGTGYMGAMMAFSAANSAARSYGMAESARIWFSKIEATPEEIDKMDLEQVESLCGRFEASVHFDGKKQADLEANVTYQQAKARERQILEGMGADLSFSDRLHNSAIRSDEAHDSSVSRQQSARRATKIAGVAGGAATPSAIFGAIGEVYQHLGGPPLNLSADNFMNIAQKTKKVRDYAFSGLHEGHADDNLPLEPRKVASRLAKGVARAVDDGAGDTVERASSLAGDSTDDALERAAREAGLNPEGAAGAAADGVEKAADAGSQVVRATSRGIEGTMIDRVEADPSGATARWLKERYPNMNYKAAIHRRMTEIAQAKGWSVDGVGQNDLSDINSADIRVNSDGSFDLNADKVSFGDNRPAAGQVREYGPHRQYGPELGKNNLIIEPEDVQEKIDSIKGDRPGLSASEITDGSLGQINEARLERTLSQLEPRKKVSDALKDLLDSDYKKFLKDDLHMDAGELNKLQGRKVSEFMSDYSNSETPPRVKREWQGLADRINKAMYAADPSKHEAMRGESIRKFLVRAALGRAK